MLYFSLSNIVPAWLRTLDADASLWWVVWWVAILLTARRKKCYICISRMSWSTSRACKRIACLHGNKDRKQNKNVPYSFPLAYALKLSNAHLQFLVDKVRNELRPRNIPVLCKTCDGQWHKHRNETCSRHRLTKFHGKEMWNKVSNLPWTNSSNECCKKNAVMNWSATVLYLQEN